MKKKTFMPEDKKGKCTKITVTILLFLSLSTNALLLYSYWDIKSFVDKIDMIYSESYFYFDSLTVDSFKEKVASGEEFIVLISRPNCSNCRMLEEPFIEFTTQNGIEDKIYLLNVVFLRREEEEWTQFKQTYGLEGTPTYARYANGEQVSCMGWTSESGIDMQRVETWIYEQKDFLGLE